ncbi:MAG TPA: helix-turn-helix domain-containing protein [Longimicrobium sp.]|jgi:excisionase family DNA binding protein
MLLDEKIDVLEPTPSAVKAARQSRGVFAEAVEKIGGRTRHGPVHLEEVDLPAEVVRALARILDELAEGRTVAVHRVADEDDEVTTNQAARILGMSRPTLIDILDREGIPYRMVGTHRRIPLSALLEYRKKMERGGVRTRGPSREERLRGLEEMADFTDRLGLGY